MSEHDISAVSLTTPRPMTDDVIRDLDIIFGVTGKQMSPQSRRWKLTGTAKEITAKLNSARDYHERLREESN